MLLRHLAIVLLSFLWTVTGVHGRLIKTHRDSSNGARSATTEFSCSDCTSFSGANLYYAAGLTSAQRHDYLQALQNASMKVLRVWLDGQSGRPKGTPIDPFPSLEPDEIGKYDDTVLERLDEFMLDAHSHGIKLQIAIHSSNAVEYAADPYGKKWNIKTFYTNDAAQKAFDARIQHVLDHKHKTLGKPWKELNDYIFAFEAQNEPMVWDGINYLEAHASWQYERAQTIKAALNGNDKILVTTGGGSWLAESFLSTYLICDAIDIVALHIYDPSDFNTTMLREAITVAHAYQKKLMVQEWVACYQNVTTGCTGKGDGVSDTNFRNEVIAAYALAMMEVGLPWMYWQVIPNADPHGDSDYEIGINTDPSWQQLLTVAQATAVVNASFDFGPYLLDSKPPTASSYAIPDEVVSSYLKKLVDV